MKAEKMILKAEVIGKTKRRVRIFGSKTFTETQVTLPAIPDDVNTGDVISVSWPDLAVVQSPAKPAQDSQEPPPGAPPAPAAPAGIVLMPDGEIDLSQVSKLVLKGGVIVSLIPKTE